MGNQKPLLWTAILAAAGTSTATAQVTGTPVAGEYYFKNVEAGKFLGSGNSWGTQASLIDHGIILKVALSEGKYTLDTNINNGSNHFFTGAWMDGASTPFEIIETATPGQYIMKNADGKFIVAEGSIVKDDGTEEGKAAKWQIIPVSDLKAAFANASFENPADATFLIKGANVLKFFGENSAWKGGPSFNDNNFPVMEKYNTNFDVYQTIEDVPAGLYKLTVQAFYREGGYTDAAGKHNGGTEKINAKLYANESAVDVPSIFDSASAAKDEAKGLQTETAAGWIPNDMNQSSLAFNAGLYKSQPLYVYVSDGKLRLGVKKESTVGADWTLFDNFELAYVGDINIDAIRDELQKKLAVQINKASAYGVDEILPLKAEASALMGDINKLTADNAEAYVICANYQSGVKGNIGEVIDDLGERITAVADNYEAYQAALKGHADLETYLLTLTAAYEGAAPETKNITKSLYEGIVQQVADFKTEAEQARANKTATTEFSDANIKTKTDNIKKAIDDALLAINSGSTNATSYANVSAKVADAKNVYADEAQKLYALLTGAPKDGAIYGDTYVEALAKLNNYLRDINGVEASNKAAYEAGKADSDSQTEYEAALSVAVLAMPGVYAEYVALVGALTEPAEGSLRANYAAAVADVDGITTSLATITAGVDKSITNYYAADIDAIKVDIAALLANVDAANVAHTIKGTAPYCDKYNTDKAAINTKLTTLQTKVSKSVAEFDANAASIATVTNLGKDFNTLTTAVGKLTSDDKKYAPASHFTATVSDILKDINKLGDDAASAYKIDGSGTAGTYNAGLDAKVTAVQAKIQNYNDWTSGSLSAYNQIAVALTSYDGLLNGTPAVGEEGKEGYVPAVPGLKEIAVNKDVTIDGALESKSYKTAIAEIEKDIASIVEAIAKANEKTDKAHYEALDAIDVKATIADAISSLAQSYEANATLWNANQLALAKTNMLNEATTRIQAFDLGEEFSADVYGKTSTELNETRTTIKTAVETIEANVNAAALKDDPTEAIAVLAAVVTDIEKLEADYKALLEKASKAEIEYAADQNALKALNASIALSVAKLNGGTVDKVEYKGVAKADNDKSRFTEEIANVNALILALNNDLATSNDAETVRQDQIDTKDDQGKVTKEGYQTRVAAIATQVNNLLALAASEVANDAALAAFDAAVTAANINTDEIQADINSVATGEGLAFFLSQLGDYKTELTKIENDKSSAYAAKVKSTLPGAIADVAKYTNTAKNMVAVKDALTNRFNVAKAGLDGLKALATANETAHTAQLTSSKKTHEAWNTIFATITGLETSQAHEAAIATLTQAKTALDTYDNAVAAEFAAGKSDVNKAALQAQIDEIDRQIKVLSDGWDDAYKAAIATDNAERKATFDQVYKALTESYQNSTDLVNKLSKLSYAANQTELLLAITGEGGIFSQIEAIRQLKTDADTDYQATEAPELWDAEEEYAAEAKALMTKVEGLAGEYAAAVNEVAKTTYTFYVDNAQSAINIAKAEIGTKLYYDATGQAHAVSDAQTIVNKAKGEIDNEGNIVHSDFAYILDNEILPALATVNDLLEADKENAAEAAWNNNMSASSKLAQAELAAIQGFGYEGAAADAEAYEAFVEETLTAAAEAWGEIAEGSKYAEGEPARDLLINYIGSEYERNLGTDEKPNKQTHTAAYWTAYDKQKAFEDNNVAYADIVKMIDDLQTEYDATKAFVGSLIVERNSNLVGILTDVEGWILIYRNQAEWYKKNSQAVDAKDWFKNSCAGQSLRLKNLIPDALQYETAAVNVEIGQLVKEYELAVATDISNTEIDKHKADIDGYQAANDRIYADFATGKVDEKGEPILDKENNPVKATAEETRAAFVALEKSMGQTKSALYAIFEADAAATAVANIEKAIAGLQTIYDAAVEQLAECHEPVVEQFQPRVEALGGAIEAAQIELAKEQAEQTVLLYEENNIATAEALAAEYGTLAGNIATAEEPYDISDAKYVELSQELADFQTRLDAVKAVADEYENKQTGDYTMYPGTDDEVTYDIFADYEYADISAYIASVQSSLDQLRDAYSLTNTSMIPAAYINDRIDWLEKELAYWDTKTTIGVIYDALSAAKSAKNLVASGSTDMRYAPEDETALNEQYDEVRQLYNYLNYYNNDAYANNAVWLDLDGEDVTTLDDDNNSVPKSVVFIEEYDAIMERAEAVAALVEAYAANVEAKAYVLGDPDKNGKINVNDYNYVRNIVIGALEMDENDPRFYAADINGDGDVNIQDVTKVSNMIMYGNFYGYAKERAAAYQTATEANSHLLVRTAGSGLKQQVVIAIDNSQAFVGGQMDILLPAGVSLVGEAGVSTHDFISGTVGGKHRVLISSLENRQLNADVLVTLDVEVSADYQGGNVEVSNAVFTDITGKKYILDTVETGDATGIAELGFGDKVKSKFYSLGGQLVDGLKKGFNLIVNPDGTTKKVYVK